MVFSESTLVPASDIGGGDGTLGVFVWPVYIGLSDGVPDPGCTGEPFMHPDYQRGQITWTAMPGGEIVGSAMVHVPAGRYTHLTYHYGPSVWPSGPQLMGFLQLEYGLWAPRAVIVPFEKINQGDWLNRPR